MLRNNNDKCYPKTEKGEKRRIEKRGDKKRM
jgi:hypothetical protein